MQLAPQTPLDRLRGALDRVGSRAESIEAPLQALRPGPVDEVSDALLGAIKLGATRTSESVITIVAAARQLRKDGHLPPGILGPIMRFEKYELAWLRIRSYLAGVTDSGVIPGFHAVTMWDSLPDLVWQTQNAARLAIAALQRRAPDIR